LEIWIQPQYHGAWRFTPPAIEHAHDLGEQVDVSWAEAWLTQ